MCTCVYVCRIYIHIYSWVSWAKPNISSARPKSQIFMGKAQIFVGKAQKIVGRTQDLAEGLGVWGLGV